MNQAESQGENIFTVVAAALEKKRVEVGLNALRDEANSLRSKNAVLRAQVDELEKMMDANIEDRERVIMQRNEQILALKGVKVELEAKVAESKKAMEDMISNHSEVLKKLISDSRIEKEELQANLKNLADFQSEYNRHMKEVSELKATTSRFPA